MIEHLKRVRAETARKKADKEIHERIISGRERDEDVDDEVEMYAEYVSDPDVQERLARAHSRAEAWEAQHEVGSGSGSGSAVGGSGSRRFSNVGDYFTRPPPTQTQVPEQGRHSKRPTGVQIEDVDPYVYPREHGKQTRIDDAYNQQGPKYKIGRAIAKWWHHTGVVDEDRRPSIGLVYAKLEAAKKKIRKVTPRHAHLVLDVVDDRWDRQMSRDLHMAAYYLHPAYHYAHELAYEDDLTAAFTKVVERLSKSPVLAADAVDEARPDMAIEFIGRDEHLSKHKLVSGSYSHKFSNSKITS
ncbi:hypothetical protein Taro_017654 [Colocasia esculenta]|uniref:Uncharacterized protein n=1 Tax=Colocasia esculenta TaxID=4460 RepID=A0A843URY3_COLES|nr:hypothetical protein [Colocasia esculenta]